MIATESPPATITIGTWLPVFSGFYNTLFDVTESESRWTRALHEANLVPEDWQPEFDYASFTHAVCKEATDWLEGIFTSKHDGWSRYSNVVPKLPPSAFGISKVEFQKLVSPREYNFTNDAVDVAVTLDAVMFGAAFSAFIADEHTAKAWAEHLRAHYKSRDGFASFYPYAPTEWRWGTRDFTFPQDVTEESRVFDRRNKLADGSHSLGRCLEFLLEEQLPDATESLYYYVCERVYPDQFITNYPEGIDTSNLNESFSL